MDLIKVSDIKREILELNKLIDDYEFIFLNLYNEIFKVTDYWQDAHAKSFFEEINLKKSNIVNVITELKEVTGIYEYMYEKYEFLGKKIEFNVNFKNKVISKCDNYMALLNEIIHSYESLDLSFCPYEARYLRNELSNLRQIRNKLINYKNNLNKKFNYIDELEKNIRLRISKIKVEILKEFDISRFI